MLELGYDDGGVNGYSNQTSETNLGVLNGECSSIIASNHNIPLLLLGRRCFFLYSLLSGDITKRHESGEL